MRVLKLMIRQKVTVNVIFRMIIPYCIQDDSIVYSCHGGLRHGKNRLYYQGADRKSSEYP